MIPYISKLREVGLALLITGATVSCSIPFVGGGEGGRSVLPKGYQIIQDYSRVPTGVGRQARATFDGYVVEQDGRGVFARGEKWCRLLLPEVALETGGSQYLSDDGCDGSINFIRANATYSGEDDQKEFKALFDRAAKHYAEQLSQLGLLERKSK